MNDTTTIELPPGTDVEEELSIPLDLTVWASATKLREWIMSDVATLNWTDADLLDLLRQHPEFEPKALLNTMTLGYATGVFAAEEIARRCSEDPEFRAVRPRLPPVPSEMKRFRKENRAAFKWSLTQIITRTLKSKFIDISHIEVLPPGLRRHVVENAVERLEIARHMDRAAEL